MAAFDYAGPLATADRLIERFGQIGAIRRAGQPSGPKHNPTPGVPTDHPAKIVMMKFSANEIDGTRILATDRKALVSPLGLAIDPTTSDALVEADGTPWKIAGVELVRPAETTVLITLQVRR